MPSALGRPRPTLVLTASVAPLATIPRLSLTKPEDRAADYSAALRLWLQQRDLFEKIVWIENSGHPLAWRIASAFGSEIVATISGSGRFPAHRGRGFGEAEMLERFASDYAGRGYLVKCTGRLYVPNIARLIGSIEDSSDLVLHMNRGLNYADSRLFAVVPNAYRRLIQGLKDEIDDSRGCYFEHALARRVVAMAEEGLRVSLWKTLPKFRGRSAATGKSYDSWRSRLIWPARNLYYRMSRSARLPHPDGLQVLGKP